MILTQRGAGPVHEYLSVGLTRCGKRLGKYLNSRQWEGDEEVTCQQCVRLAAKGERRAWRSR